MKYLGIDYGKQRIGLAIGDTITRIAVGKDILHGLSTVKVIHYIQECIQTEDIDALVIGVPTNMSGQDTQFTTEVKEFIQQLQQAIPIPIEIIDERLTSQMAQRALQPIAKKRGHYLDQVAAQFILQTFLDKLPD